MGVPAFYRWLSQRYPKAIIPAVADEPESIDGISIPGASVEYSKPNPNGELDNLYLDMNGIVHPCTHPEGRPAPETEDEMMLEVFRYTEKVLSIAKPRKVLMMAVDGVAPRAKMNQQRSRRFRSAQDAKIAMEEDERKAQAAAAIGQTLDESIKDSSKKHWDTNVITPGTPFMDFLAQSLRYWVAYKLNTEPGWKDLKVIISDATVPGEGEHKIMEFIRSQRNMLQYDPNTSHCIYGLDADLIFLGLATHEPNFRVLREDVFNQNKVAGKTKGHIWLDVGVLRQYLEIELSCDVGFWDMERAIDDWIFMAFFCGNDFLPHLPSLDVRENGLDILLRSWRHSLPRLGGFMTKDGDVLLSRVQIVLSGVASQEGEIFKKRHDIEERREASRKQQQLAKRYKRVGATDRNPNQPVEDIQLYTTTGEAVNSGNSSSAANPLSGIAAGSKRTFSQQEQTPPSADQEEENELDDEVKLWKPGYHDRYYQTKFQIDPKYDKELVRNVVHKYIEGVCWTLKYYYQGCPSWTWFYPYHYAPFAKDLVDQDLGSFEIKFTENTVPFLPFEQLMSVLPAASSHTLPKLLRPLMSDPESPIIDFYPVDFPIDMNGKKMAWQGVALLPFIDEARLLSAIREKYAELGEEDMARNTRKEAVMLVSPNSPIQSKLLELYEGGHHQDKAVVVNNVESKGLGGTMKADPSWEPHKPLLNTLQVSNTDFEDLPKDESVTVEYTMPSNQKHKSMLLEGYKEPPLVLGPSDIDTIWYRRKRSDRGDDRPDYRKRELYDFKEARPKRSGGYLSMLEAFKTQDSYNVSGVHAGYDHHGYGDQSGSSEARYNQHSQGIPHQAAHGHGYQGYQGYQGYRGNGDYKSHQNQSNYHDYQRYNGYRGYQGYNVRQNAPAYRK